MRTLFPLKFTLGHVSIYIIENIGIIFSCIEFPGLIMSWIIYIEDRGVVNFEYKVPWVWMERVSLYLYISGQFSPWIFPVFP